MDNTALIVFPLILREHYLDRAVVQYFQARECLDAAQALPNPLAVESHSSCPLGSDPVLPRRNSESLDAPA